MSFFNKDNERVLPLIIKFTEAEMEFLRQKVSDDILAGSDIGNVVEEGDDATNEFVLSCGIDFDTTTNEIREYYLLVASIFSAIRSHLPELYVAPKYTTAERTAHVYDALKAGLTDEEGVNTFMTKGMELYPALGDTMPNTFLMIMNRFSVLPIDSDVEWVDMDVEQPQPLEFVIINDDSNEEKISIEINSIETCSRNCRLFRLNKDDGLIHAYGVIEGLDPVNKLRVPITEVMVGSRWLHEFPYLHREYYIPVRVNMEEQEVAIPCTVTLQKTFTCFGDRHVTLPLPRQILERNGESVIDMISASLGEFPRVLFRDPKDFEFYTNRIKELFPDCDTTTIGTGGELDNLISNLEPGTLLNIAGGVDMNLELNEEILAKLLGGGVTMEDFLAAQAEGIDVNQETTDVNLPSVENSPISDFLARKAEAEAANNTNEE